MTALRGGILFCENVLSSVEINNNKFFNIFIDFVHAYEDEEKLYLSDDKFN